MADKDFVVKNGIVVNTAFTANSTQIKLGSNVVTNTSAILIGNSTTNTVISAGSVTINGNPVGLLLSANNTDTSAYYIPLSNATSGSWTNAVVSNTKLSYVPSTGSLAVSNSVNLGNSTANSTANGIGFISQVGAMNQQTLGFGTYSTNASLNMVIAGPFTVATGNTFTITTGSRVVIV